jgi:hypothetical protein
VDDDEEVLAVGTAHCEILCICAIGRSGATHAPWSLSRSGRSQQPWASFAGVPAGRPERRAVVRLDAINVTGLALRDARNRSRAGIA